MAKKHSKRSPIDRRRHPREFFIAGWDPYIVSLKERDQAGKPDEEDQDEDAPQRRRSAVVKDKTD